VDCHFDRPAFVAVGGAVVVCRGRVGGGAVGGGDVGGGKPVLAGGMALVLIRVGGR